MEGLGRICTMSTNHVSYVCTDLQKRNDYRLRKSKTGAVDFCYLENRITQFLGLMQVQAREDSLCQGIACRHVDREYKAVV